MPPSEQPQTNGQTTVSAIQDAVYGTRNYTPGARYQLPRKVPLRIEPKTYFGEPDPSSAKALEGLYMPGESSSCPCKTGAELMKLQTSIIVLCYVLGRCHCEGDICHLCSQ